MTDYQPMSPEELARLTEMFATPIDFDELIAQGALEKRPMGNKLTIWGNMINGTGT